MRTGCSLDARCMPSTSPAGPAIVSPGNITIDPRVFQRAGGGSSSQRCQAGQGRAVLGAHEQAWLGLCREEEEGRVTLWGFVLGEVSPFWEVCFGSYRSPIVRDPTRSSTPTNASMARGTCMARNTGAYLLCVRNARVPRRAARRKRPSRNAVAIGHATWWEVSNTGARGAAYRLVVWEWRKYSSSVEPQGAVKCARRHRLRGGRIRKLRVHYVAPLN
jgi:hypothetical protein